MHLTWTTESFFKPRSKHVSLNDASQSECLKNCHIWVQQDVGVNIRHELKVGDYFWHMTQNHMIKAGRIFTLVIIFEMTLSRKEGFVRFYHGHVVW